VTKLEELGIHDSYLWELQHLVAAEIRAMFPHSTA
jgi:cation transport regulator ChaC